MKHAFLFLLLCIISGSIHAQTSTTRAYVNDIKTHGKEPMTFVNDCLAKYDLLIFDDALHHAYEPFVFYNQLVNNPAVSKKIDYIFLEAINTNSQPLIDSFLNKKVKDSTILIKVFQDDYSGFGWRNQTYLDLFDAVWEHNKGLPDSLRIKIVGVSPPVYWEGIHTWKDYEIFQSSMKSRDYFMYLEILEKMKNFGAKSKGIFLCNSRHAYTHVANSKGELYWNTTTFFAQRNPGKTFSIRIHNVTLSIQAARKLSSTEKKSTDGLSEMVYKWIKMDDGRWDSAFAANSNKPVALPLKNTAFGKTAYAGNYMNVKKGTVMADAYDAIIFLAPLTALHFSARMNYIYTPEFKPELERRLKILKGSDYDNYLKRNDAANFEEFYKRLSVYEPVTKNALAEN